MKGINLAGLDMRTFVGTGYNPSQNITNTNGRDDGKFKQRDSKGIKSPQEPRVEGPKERPEVYY